MGITDKIRREHKAVYMPWEAGNILEVLCFRLRANKYDTLRVKWELKEMERIFMGLEDIFTVCLIRR